MPSWGGLVLQSLLKMVLHLKGNDWGSKVSWLFLGGFCASFWDQRYFIDGNCQSFLSRAVVQELCSVAELSFNFSLLLSSWIWVFHWSVWVYSLSEWLSVFIGIKCWFYSFMYAFSMALLSLLLSVDWMVTAFLFPFPVRRVAGHQQLPGAEQAEISLSAERWRASTGRFFNPLHLKLFCESCAVSEDQLFTAFLV